MFVPRDLEKRVYKATQGRVQGASTNLNTAYPQFLNNTNVYGNLQIKEKAAFLPQEHPVGRKPATGFWQQIADKVNKPSARANRLHTKETSIQNKGGHSPTDGD